MIRLFTDPRMQEHQPAKGHPESPERLAAIIRHLERTGLADACTTGLVRPATDAELRRVHDEGYIDRVEAYDRAGGGHIEPDTWMSPGSHLAARLAAGAAIEAVSAALKGPDRRAFCAVRPPGHHARPADAMGFCLFANAAAAAASALADHELNRLLIVDFDVHHGNGTQEIFERDPRVGFLSIHRYPFYPGTGARDETGSGPGLGFTCNVPVQYGTRPADYRAAFRAALEHMADRVRPELVLVSAGFDAHAEDPVGDLGLDVEDFDAITRDIVAVAETHASGRLVSMLEGGYNVPILAGCVAAHLQALGAEPTRR